MQKPGQERPGFASKVVKGLALNESTNKLEWELRTFCGGDRKDVLHEADHFCLLGSFIGIPLVVHLDSHEHKQDC